MRSFGPCDYFDYRIICLDDLILYMCLYIGYGIDGLVYVRMLEFWAGYIVFVWVYIYILIIAWRLI